MKSGTRSIGLLTLTGLTLVTLATIGMVTSTSNHVTIPSITAVESQAFMNKVVLLASQKLRPAQQPIGPGRLLGIGHHDAITFIYIAYPLRRSEAGCVGTIALPIVYVDKHWHIGGWFAGWSCLSRQIPFTFDYYSTSFLNNFSVVYARALPVVRSIKVIKSQGEYVISPHNGVYLAFAACTDIQRVQALDVHGRVLYEQTVTACP